MPGGDSPVPADRVPVPADGVPASVPAPSSVPASASEGLTAPAVPPRPTARQRVAGRSGLRLGLIAAAAVLVAAGVVVGADPLRSLLGGEESGRGSRSAVATPDGSATLPAPLPSPPGGAGSTPSAVGGTLSVPPSGYRTFADPQGFAIAVPEGYQRATDDQRVFYVSPDGAFRIGIRVKMPVPGGPLGVMRQAHAKGPDTNPGYRAGTVVSTTHHELPAALWEFTWNGFTPAEGDRHTYDLCWDQNGRMYDIWVSAPVGELIQAKRHFDTAVATFVPGVPGSVTP